MYRYILMPAALKDLQRITDYLALELHAPDSADEFLTAVDEALEKACRMPLALPPLTDELFNAYDIRKVLIKNYIAYVIPRDDKKTLTVLRILYYRQDHRSQLP